MASEYTYHGILQGIKPALDYKGNPEPDCQELIIRIDSGLATGRATGDFPEIAKLYGKEIKLTGPITVKYSEKMRRTFTDLGPGKVTVVGNTGNVK
jgi:hypothetical protein